MILKTSDKESERWNKARLHDEAMQEKYGHLNGMSAAYDDYHYWYEERADKPGYYRHDYPLPYSDRYYFRRFCELFFSSGAERNMLPTLEHEFLGDKVDSDYINGLLISAEFYGFFNPGAIIIFNGSTVSWQGPPATKGGRYMSPTSKDTHQQVYEGSKANKDRAKVIRRWLKARAKELASTPHAVSSVTVAQSTSSEQNPSPPNNSAFSIQRQSPQATFSPFVPNGAFTVENADALANVIRLINDAGSFLGKFPSARLYGFYSHLRCKEVLRGTDEELRDYFFMRYLKKTSKSHPTSDTTAGKTVAKDTEKAFKRWEKEQESRINQGGIKAIISP